MKRLRFFISILIGSSIAWARSPFRPVDPHLPSVRVSWVDDQSDSYTIVDSHLEKYPLFAFNKKFIKRYHLPQTYIIYPNKKGHVHAYTLRKLVNGLIEEIQEGRRTFTHFTIIKKKNFSFRKQSGLLIVAFKDHPFVVKLLMEKPRTFFDFYAKGIEPTAFFYMSGGTNRHILGLTRIKNRENILHRVEHLPEWKDRIIMPRKWFVLPHNPRWLELHGTNLGEDTRPITISIPACYAIIADKLDLDQHVEITEREKKNTIFQLCNELDQFLDAHWDNFSFAPGKEKNKPNIIIIDTEHYPSIVGLKEKKSFANYVEWYKYLTIKGLYDCYFRTKSARYAAQRAPHKLMLVLAADEEERDA